MSHLIRVVAPHFVAGLMMTGDVCTEAAPILKWAIGKTRADLRQYFTKKGWLAMEIGFNAGYIADDPFLKDGR
jgi:hypothetical protein